MFEKIIEFFCNLGYGNTADATTAKIAIGQAIALTLIVESKARGLNRKFKEKEELKKVV